MPRVNKLIYIADNFPGPKARHLQMAKMVDAFMDNSVDVRFLLRKHKEKFTNDVRSYYGVKNDFRYERIKSFKFLPINYDYYFKYNFRKVLMELTRNGSGDDTVIYARYGKKTGYIVDTVAKYKKIFEGTDFPEVIAEVHQGLNSKEVETVKLLDGIVAISEGVEQELLECGVDGSRICLARSGVDLRAYEEGRKRDRSSILSELNLPADKKLIVYTGHLYEDRGVETLIRSAGYLSNDFLIVVIGGLKGDIARVNSLVKNKGFGAMVTLRGNKPQSQIPLYQLCADVLVMPYSSKWTLQNWSSPIKLFEYMAAGKPIVSTDFNVIRNVVGDDSCVFVEPDNPEEMSDAIKKCINESAFSERIGNRTLEKVQNYGWGKRAKKIIDFISGI